MRSGRFPKLWRVPCDVVRIRSKKWRCVSSPQRHVRRGANSGTRGTSLPRLVGIAEIADHLGVTVRHVRLLVAQRRIPYMKWGHLLRFDPDQVREWLDEAHVDPRVAKSRSTR
jgi:excisionase family DNA binding protein